MFLNLIILTISIIFIWNHSGFIFDMSKFIYQKLNKDKPYMGQSLMKPFGCSLCMIFWTSFIYSLFTTTLIYSLGIGVLLAISSILIDKVIMVLIRLINRIK